MTTISPAKRVPTKQYLTNNNTFQVWVFNTSPVYHFYFYISALLPHSTDPLLSIKNPSSVKARCLSEVFEWGHHTWQSIRRQPLHFIFTRQFSMFTSSLSAWETLTEGSRGANRVLSPWVTAETWFNGSVCQRDQQQPVIPTAQHRYHPPRQIHGKMDCDKTPTVWMTLSLFTVVTNQQTIAHKSRGGEELGLLFLLLLLLILYSLFKSRLKKSVSK